MDWIPLGRYFFPRPSLPTSTPPTSSATTAAPSQQSTAALLPQEVIDQIFRHFDFNYSLDADSFDLRKRVSGLSRASRVVKSWTAPARRLLFRTVVVEFHPPSTLRREWFEKMTNLAGPHIHNLSCSFPHYVKGVDATAAATIRLLTRIPNLRQLRLENVPFRQFSDADSVLLRCSPCLLQLTELRLSFRKLRPEYIVSDLLAASNRHIERLSYISNHEFWEGSDSDSEFEEESDDDSEVGEEEESKEDTELMDDDEEEDEPGPRLDRWKPSEEILDFGGNLKYLLINCPLVCFVGRGGVGKMEGLAGLEQLAYCESLGEEDEVEELVRAVGRSLVKLDIRGFNAYSKHFARCERLAHIHFDRRSVTATFGIEDSPLGGHFPDSLAHLHIHNDLYLLPTLIDWQENSSLKPASLVQLTIDELSNDDLVDYLPNLDVLMVSSNHHLERNLRALQPDGIPFKKLKFFSPRTGPSISKRRPAEEDDSDVSEDEGDWYKNDLKMDDDPFTDSEDESDEQVEMEEEVEITGTARGSTVIAEECDLLGIRVFTGSVSYMFEEVRFRFHSSTSTPS